jgi:hypothetical protein
METSVRMYSRCDINVVVGAGESLAAPVIKDAGAKGLKSISDEVTRTTAPALASTNVTAALG